MATLNEALFEAPGSHEAAYYNNSYSNPEFESEWETFNPEMSNEWETNPEFEHEWEAFNPEMSNEWETNPEFEHEWELSNEWETNPEFEHEWETNLYANPEMVQEGEYFSFKKLARIAAPLAKKLAPIAARTLVGMIPVGGAVAGPLAGKLTAALVQEAEMEVAQMEASFFGTNEAEAEVANNEMAHEAALTEFLASQAAEASTAAEAEAAIAAALPITITIMGGKRALRPVMPAMTQATGRLTNVMRQQGTAGRQLFRTISTIQRQTVATLKAAARSGQPINSATAVKAMAVAANRVLSNPQTVQKAVVRNAALRQRTAPPHPRRVSTSMPRTARPTAQPLRCPKCATAVR